MSDAYFIGIDVGTQGVRVVLLDERGRQLQARSQTFALDEKAREEQSPIIWWDCCKAQISSLLAEGIIDNNRVKAIAVTSTSGTIIPLDHQREPLHPAIMYSDPRSIEEAKLCKAVAASEISQGYSAFNVSSGLPKMRWFMNKYPDKISSLYKFIHAADFITGRLCGVYDVTDYTNALKSGFDLHQYHWPSYITDKIGVKVQWLQKVKPSGEPLEIIDPILAKEWNLPRAVVVTTGMTDGCASQVAAGAISPGQWNTTIGTTLVIKGVTQKEVIDPTGAIYNHRHPDGYWMPGGASNTGADWVTRFFSGENLELLSKEAANRLPASQLAWPILQLSERFPFVAPHVEGFWPENDTVEKFTACMEGVAFIERYAYERLMLLSGEKVDRILTAGGASDNDTWMLIRSCAMKRPVCKMKNVSGAAGAAILAASRTYYGSLSEAVKTMVVAERTIEPNLQLVDAYEEKYQKFIRTLKEKNILD